MNKMSLAILLKKRRLIQEEPDQTVYHSFLVHFPLSADIRVNDKIIWENHKYILKAPKGSGIIIGKSSRSGMKAYENSGAETAKHVIKKAASGGFSRQASQWLEECGQDFLEIVNLNSSAHKRLIQKNCSVPLRKAQRTISGLCKAAGFRLWWVHSLITPHFLMTAIGLQRRREMGAGAFQGSRFIYDPAASTGMALKRKWIQARATGIMHFFI